MINAAQNNTPIEISQEQQGLQDLVYGLVSRFLAENKNKSIDGLYDMILSEVEPPPFTSGYGKAQRKSATSRKDVRH
jgi:DNA-binding protein Fis